MDKMALANSENDHLLGCNISMDHVLLFKGRRSSLFAKQTPSLQVDISTINDAGLTPLHQAVLDGNEAAVRLLVAHGSTVNKQDEDSWTPLHAACAEGHVDIVSCIYYTVGFNNESASEFVRKRETGRKDTKGCPLSGGVCIFDNIKDDDVSMLRNASLQVDISVVNGTSGIALGAYLQEYISAVNDEDWAVLDGKRLVAHGATVNKQDEDSGTPLHAACAEGHADIAT
ncbi:PPR27-like protein [Mya arenaria]|uniref:PPR27-like protein n=1 Tax=Mya arenaria TaxID=6604 RepID=A0ABY7FHQ2_MYAAR|nr:PPR27-like protein [Mya arenaria]